MKNMFKQSSTLSDLLDKQKALLTEQLAVKGGLAMLRWYFVLFSVLFAKAPTKSNVRIIKLICRKFYVLNRDSGTEFLILYLKTSATLLQQYCGRQEILTQPRLIAKTGVSVTRRGLPRFIPRVQRRLIRKGDIKVISFWLSVFNSYRYLICKHKDFSAATIVSPYTGTSTIFMRLAEFIPVFWSHLKVRQHQGLAEIRGKGVHFLTDKVSALISRQSGVTGTSYEAVMKAVFAWRGLALSVKDKTFGKDLILFRAFMRVMLETFPSLMDILMPKVESKGEGDLPEVHVTFHMQPFTYFWRQRTGDLVPHLKDAALGRLVALKEAAGKLRTVAIVDPLTQWILRPVHLWLFRVLSKIKEDGTFDQLHAIKTFAASGSKWRFVSKAVSSLDLSAATDRLPLRLQVMLLSWPFGSQFAEAWGQLLTQRPYIKALKPYFYAVGQPMGALSSWASLAITHHFMWQCSAWISGVVPRNEWYDKYRVLGDDSAARLKRVWETYLALCAELGVGISLPKSLISPVGAVEFAKKFFTPKGNASPVSVGELLVARVCFPVAVQLLGKYPHIRIADLLRLYGYRFKVLGSLNLAFQKLPKKARHIVIVATSPWGPRPVKSICDWLAVSCLGGERRDMEWGLATVELLLLVDKLWYKAQLIRDRHKSDRRFSFLDGLKSTAGEAVKLVRADPDLQKALYASVYAPLAKDVAGKAHLIVLAVRALRKRMQIRNFMANDLEFEEFFTEFRRLEDALNNLRQDCFKQEITEDDIIPSARSTLALYHRLAITVQISKLSKREELNRAKREASRKPRPVKPWIFKSYHDMVGRY